MNDVMRTVSEAPMPSTERSSRRPDGHRGRLFRKYLLLILTLVTIALLASGAISIYFTYQEAKSSLADLQHEKALGAASRIEEYVHQIERQIAYAALPQLDPGDVELRRVEFLKLLRQAPEVTDVAQIDASGHERLAVSRLGMDSVGSNRDRAQEPAFRESKADRTWFGPVYFRKETEPYMTIAVRAGGDRGAVTVADVNLKFIWDVVSRIRIGDKGKAYVVDEGGYLVADPDIGLVLRKTNLSALPHVRAAMTAPGDGGNLAMVSTDLAGKRVLTSMAPIESLKWNVFVEQPVSEVYAKLNASILRTALLLLAGLMLSALGALALARGMVRPIRTLEEGAQRIGTGELDQRIVVRTGDELEALADQFNRMSGKLRESYAGLEQKVEARTRELANALEQQTAISEILRVISSSPTDVQPVFEIIAERALNLCGAQVSVVSRVDNGEVRLAAVDGVTEEGRAELEKIYPLPLTANTVTTRAMRARAVVQVDDVLADSTYDARNAATIARFRGSLCAPMIREGDVIGAIYVGQREPARFTESQVELLETFADQAVIAIENVRLLNETKEALEQQQASAEVLSVIGSSVSDTAPVFTRIAESCKRLFDVSAISINLVGDDGQVHLGYYDGPNADQLRSVFPGPLNPDSSTGLAILERRVIHHPDVLAGSDVPVYTRKSGEATGVRSVVFAPMIWKDRGIGVIVVGREVVQPFTEKEIALLKTFADQAVIAIQNARLFNETREALERQTAMSEILRVISRSPTDVKPVFDTIAAAALGLCDSVSALVFTYDGALIHIAAIANLNPEDEQAWRDEFPRPPSHDTATARAILTGNTAMIPDVLADPEYTVSEMAVKTGFRAAMSVPLIRDGKPIGAIGVGRSEPGTFHESEISLLKTFADQAVIAIENVRLFNETNEALQQQTAVAEILRVISSSPTDVKPVLEAIAERAAKLCDASAASMYMIDGDALRHLASRGSSPDPVTHVDTLPINGETITGRAVLERRTIHVADLLAEGDEYPLSCRIAQGHGHRTVVVTPLLREGQPFGAILLRRNEVRAFSDREIALLRTFGDQAAIALENVRLFNETKEALEQQRASGEVLAAISSSIADTAPVFETILASCERLFAGKIAVIDLIGEDDLVHLGAYHGPRREAVLDLYPHPADASSATGSAIAARSVVHYPSVRDLPGTARHAFRIFGIQAAIGAPMIWESRGIGAIWVARDRSGPFSDKEIALLRTFADQAVIAIQNARLFREIQDKSRQLEVANKHKSDFLANMSHELRTPLNAIIGFSEVLLERLFGDLNVKQDDYLKDIHSSGRHLLSLINDILDLSKIEAGRMELEPSCVDVAPAIANALTLVRERAQHHAITLVQDVDPALGTVVADERKLKQILLNLLSNAVKFTPDGGRIDVTARRAGALAEIAVRDTGIGIAAADQDAVFEEFRQVGRDYTRKQEGTGLGLALTRKFVELHGGRIWLESEPGRGSTFTFTIPLSQ